MLGPSGSGLCCRLALACCRSRPLPGLCCRSHLGGRQEHANLFSQLAKQRVLDKHRLELNQHVRRLRIVRLPLQEPRRERVFVS